MTFSGYPPELPRESHQRNGGCVWCNYPRMDGIQTHAWDCEWCTLCQRIGHIEAFLAVKDKETHGSSEEPTTQRTGEPLTVKQGIVWYNCPRCGALELYGATCARCAPADTSPAEPASPEADSAVPPGAEPERAG